MKESTHVNRLDTHIRSGILGGALCATLFAFAALVPNVGTAMLSTLAPLPLFLVGFSFGRKAATVAVIASSILIALIASPLQVIPHVLMNGLPIILLVDRILAMRDDISLELALKWICGIAVVFAGVGSFILSLVDSAEVLKALLDPKAMASQPKKVMDFMILIMPYMPGFFALSWCAGVIANMSLAQGVLTGIEKSMVATPSLKDLALSKAWLIPLIVCLSVSFVGAGFVTLLAQNLLFVLLLPFLLQGLAPIHGGLSRGMLMFFYFLMFFMMLFLFLLPLLFVAFAGIIITLRRKTAL